MIRRPADQLSVKVPTPTLRHITQRTQRPTKTKPPGAPL